MNYDLDLNRRPMKETVAKFARSNKFLLAVIFGLFASIITAVTSCAEYISLFDLQFLLEYSREPIYKFYLTDIYIYISIGLTLFILLLAIFQFACLMNIRSYFTGKAENPSGIKGFLTLFVINVIVSIIQLPFTMFYAIMTFESTLGGKELYGVFSLFFILILITVLPAIIVLTVFQYKGIKKSFNFSLCAFEERNYGKPSSFLLVFTIITLAMLVISLLSTSISLFTLFASYAYKTVSGLIFNYILPLLSTIFSFVSTLLYVIIMVKFKAEMKIAKQESFIIQAQLASIRAREYAAKQAQASNSFDNTQI